MTREERKRLREDVKMWRACLSLERSAVGVCITPVHVADVSALLDALDEADSKTDRLAHFIIGEIPGEPSQNQGAVDTAIRVMTSLKVENVSLRHQLAELYEHRKHIVSVNGDLTAENAALRERVAALEKVREAARQFISSFDTEIPEDADSEQVNKLVGQYTHAADALRAALDKAGER